ncbi:MAG: hypothetical protein J7L61_03550 [Thermoplasmata archaeon]|nr:hypothetical protein [Thermoplasmata archaeon]
MRQVKAGWGDILEVSFPVGVVYPAGESPWALGLALSPRIKMDVYPAAEERMEGSREAGGNTALERMFSEGLAFLTAGIPEGFRVDVDVPAVYRSYPAIPLPVEEGTGGWDVWVENAVFSAGIYFREKFSRLFFPEYREKREGPRDGVLDARTLRRRAAEAFKTVGEDRQSLREALSPLCRSRILSLVLYGGVQLFSGEVAVARAGNPGLWQKARDSPQEGEAEGDVWEVLWSDVLPGLAGGDWTKAYRGLERMGIPRLVETLDALGYGKGDRGEEEFSVDGAGVMYGWRR